MQAIIGGGGEERGRDGLRERERQRMADAISRKLKTENEKHFINKRPSMICFKYTNSHYHHNAPHVQSTMDCGSRMIIHNS